MNQATKRIITVVFAIGLCFHFCMLFIYCAPIKVSNQKINFVNNLYVYPFFHQNWGLFVPAPNVERKLFVRYKVKNGFTKWEDILSNKIRIHKQNRLLGYESIVLLLSNSLIYELNYLDKKPSAIIAKKPTNKGFKVLQFEVEKLLELEYSAKCFFKYELLLVSSGKDTAKAYYIKSLIID